MKKILLAFSLLFVVSSNASNENNQQEGVEKTYYESGKLNEVRTYKNDKQEGLEKTHYESGKLKSETTYKDGKKEGVEKTYYNTGKLKSIKILKSKTTEKNVK